MSTSKAKRVGVPLERWVTLTAAPDGVLDATRPIRTHRFLMCDGSTVDVRTDRDDSDLRVALLEHTGLERIVGSTVLPPDRTKPDARD